MSDEPDSLVLRFLRRIDARVEELVADAKDVKQRLNSLEGQVSLLHNDIVHVHHRIDRVEERLKRIETRLDLIDA
jgi:predicted  nucleic acid-binding Zn-ribbon protein